MFLRSPYSSVGTNAIFLVLARAASAVVAATPCSLLVDCISLDRVAIDLSMKFALSIPSSVTRIGYLTPQGLCIAYWLHAG